MKTIVALTVLLFALVPAQAQVFLSSGYYNNHGHRHYSHHAGYYHSYPGYRYYGCGPRYYPYGPSIGYGVTYYSQPDYEYSSTSYQRPNYAVSGLMLGGLTGAIIGSNSYSHDSWEAAAWGAGAGLLIGSIAEHNARKREASEAEAQEAQATAVVAPTAPAEAVQPKPLAVPVIKTNNPPPKTPMSAANGMFGR
jgi:hypothetical protein